MTTRFVRIHTLLALACLSAPALAEVRLPAIISNHMVLLRAAKVPVWGWAGRGEQVSVQIGGQKRTATAAADGSWRIDLDLARAGATPTTLTVRGADNAITVDDVLVGEVWLASGQSNMQKPLGQQKGQKPTFDFEAETAAADHPDIRLFKVARNGASQPQQDVAGEWVRCSPGSIEQTKFSAAAYYFGRRLNAGLHAPVGLIDSTVGGTRIELWTPAGATDAKPDADPARAKILGQPSSLYNGMIDGLAPFALRGVIWYQGESNIMDTDDGPAYTAKMEALVGSWRQRWQSAFPFYYVQVAPHLYSVVRGKRVSHGAESEPLMWEAQAQALRIPGSGMIVTTDLVDDLRDIHPRDKKSVGLRLANLALAKTYGVAGIEPDGPAYRAMRVEGDRAILTFEHADGLAARDGKPLDWFEVAGSDGVYHPAQATIEGRQVVVRSEQVAEPRSVRFAWNEAAQPNLVNGAGLPAIPFRSEQPIPPSEPSR
jgi:sialate O-acetylesterase